MSLSDVAAERAVLAGLCQYGSNAYADVAGIISTTSFTVESNSIYFECLEHLFKNGCEKPDPNTIWSAATTLNYGHILGRTDEIAYLRGLLRCQIELSNVRKMAIKLRRLEIARLQKATLIKAAHTIDKCTGDEPISKILGIGEEAIFSFNTNLHTGTDTGPSLMSDGLRQYVEYLKNNQCDITGISTGYRRIDHAFGGGLQVGVNIVGARPKIGKTTLADNVGQFIGGVLNTPVLNLDTEMNKKQHWDRLLAFFSNVNIKEIKNGTFANDENKCRKVEQAVAKLEKMPYSYESIIGAEIEDVLAIARRWVMKKVGLQESGLAKPCAIIYDYLKLASPDSLKSMQEWQALGFQINALHNFMAKYEIPCLALIQLNRDGINREETDVISGSDRQVWTCVNLGIFKKKSDEELSDNESRKWNRKFVPLVSRFGEEWPDDTYINMQMQGQFARITEGKTNKEVETDKQRGEFVDDPDKIPPDTKQF